MAEEQQFSIGDRVSLTNSANKDQEGVIKFLGALEGKDGKWCGIELIDSKGTHSGEFNGKRYFECKENHGLFVREKHLMLIKSSEPAASQQVEPEKIPQQAATGPVEKKPKLPLSSSSKTIIAAGSSNTATAKTVSKAISDKPPSSASTKSSSSMQGSSSSSSITSKKDQELIIQRDLEISQLKEELDRKEETMNDLTNTISELQDKLDFKDISIGDLNEMIKKLEQRQVTDSHVLGEKDKKLLEKQADLEKALEDISMLNSGLKDLEETVSLIDDLTIAKEDAELYCEKIKKELDQKIAENKQLHDEKRLAQIELEEAMAGAVLESDSAGDGANAELIKNNARLRQAVQVLNDQLDMEKIESLEKIIDLESKIEKLPELEATIADLLQQIDTQKLQLIKKNEEIEDLKETLEIHAESVEMVEQLTDKKQELEEKIMAQKIEIKELKEFKKVNDDLITGYEESYADLQNENTQLEYQIYEQKRLVQEKEDQLLDSEKVIEILRQRAKSLKDQTESYKQEVFSSENASTSSAEKAVSDIQKLLEQQQELFAEKRIIYKKYVNSNIFKINIGIESECKQNVYLDSIPDSIKARINSEGFKQIITTQRNKKKAQLLLQELLFYLDRQSSALIQQENLAVFTWIESLLSGLNLFINNLTRFEAKLISVCTESELIDLMKRPYFSSVVAGGMFIDSLLKQLIDDNISPKLALDPIFTANNKISEEEKAQESCQNNLLKPEIETRIVIEKNIEQVRLALNALIFTSKFNAGPNNNTNTDMLFSTLQKRITEFLTYFNQVSVCSTSLLQLNPLKLTKLAELSQILCEQIFHIPKERSNLYLSPIKTELKEELDEKQITDQEQQEREAISGFRKIISETANLLSNLNTEIDQKVQVAQGIQENEFITNKQTYWAKVVERTREELDGMSKIIENEKKLTDELTGSIKQVVSLEKSVEDLKKVKASLEQRVVQLQITSERVSGLENEKKRFAEKEKSFKEATDLIQKELDISKKKFRDAQEEIKNLKNPNNEIMQSTTSLQTSQMQRTSVSRLSIGPSLKSTMSTKISDIPGLQVNQRSSIVANNEETQDLVKLYEAENNILRSIQLKDRMKKLTSQHSNLKTMKLLKEKKPDGDLSQLVQSVKNIGDIHSQGLTLLANKKVIDLSELVSQNLAQKDENITQHLLATNTQIESLRFEAYKICNSISKKVASNPTSFKQRLELPYSPGAGPAQELLKIGSISLNHQGDAAAPAPAPLQATRLTVSIEDWRRIKQVF